MNIPILFDDDTLLAIDKPPGVVVNRAQSVKGETVQEWAEKKLQIRNPKSEIRNNCKIQNPNDRNYFEFRASNFEFIQRAGIVHRIDKETSGILLIAKTPDAFADLQRQFKERLVKKTYLAIVHGNVVPEAGEIRAPVGRLPWNTEHFGIVPGGKEAVTRYRVIASIAKQSQGDRHVPHGGTRDDFSLVELYPETGRTHQIRVHLKYINHPIVGDYLYAGRKVARNDRVWAPRVMLHAWKISFAHPQSMQPLAIEAPIPDDMGRIMKN